MNVEPVNLHEGYLKGKVVIWTKSWSCLEWE
ncbi:hypothetical protein F0521_15040 [Ferrimonas sp. YFM]|nr:hypothetical protein F0521_15040 [Ferrimonas sp. YFM]